MFGPDVYFRLFELHNRALWPFPIIAALTGVACLVLVAMRGRVAVRTALILAALACLGAANFLVARCAPINWPMRYGAWAFAFEAGLLTLMGVSGCLATPSTSGRATKIAGHGLLALALVLYPFPGLAFGRPLAQAEIFGLAPRSDGHRLSWHAQPRHGG